MDRRTFVGTGTAALAALALPRIARGQACTDLTVEDNYGLGPFYTAGAPSKTKLASEFEPGQRIAISGTVRNCASPLPGVTLDLWHATESGCYQHPNDACPDVPGHPETFRLRGKVITDAEGKFAFESILPGAYLNGAKYRPRHIHAIITHPTLDEIVTQLYFEGDPYIAGDFGADAANAANRIIPFSKTDAARWTAVWNIRVPGTSTGIHDFSDPAFGDFDAVVRRLGDRFLIALPGLEIGRRVELRLYGPDGSLLRRTFHDRAPIEVGTAGMAQGAYLAELSWRTPKGVRTESVTLRP
jgi:catechol 1,2-dioxygenase